MKFLHDCIAKRATSTFKQQTHYSVALRRSLYTAKVIQIAMYFICFYKISNAFHYFIGSVDKTNYDRRKLENNR